MISPDEAKASILDILKPIGAKRSVFLYEASGKILSTDVIAPVSLPPFDQSAVDGYAVSIEDPAVTEWEVQCEIKAGDKPGKLESPKQSCRIFTGAPVPQGANSVIMQEKVKVVSETKIKTAEPVDAGANIRRMGSQIEKGKIAVRKGSVINPSLVGFLASLGIQSVNVFSAPSVAVIITGNELAEPGADLVPGQVFESNSVMVQVALKAAGVEQVVLFHAKDDPAELKNVVDKAASQCDVVILTGGISVGKYDLVKDCLFQLDVEQIFYKIAQKPGKPMFFGIKGTQPFFALPGNPAAVLTCFYEYVYPGIRKMTGADNVSLPSLRLPLVSDINKKQGLVNFLKGKITSEGVMPLSGQESYILKSFSEADALIVLEADVVRKHAGELVEVHILPFN